MKQRSPLTTEEQEKAKILHASGKTVYATARALGRSHHTLAKFLHTPEVVKDVQVEKSELAQVYREKARKVVESISDTDISDASLQQKCVSTGILLDKSLLLTGEGPSALNISVLLEVAAIIRRESDETPALPAFPPRDPSALQGQK